VVLNNGYRKKNPKKFFTVSEKIFWEIKNEYQSFTVKKKFFNFSFLQKIQMFFSQKIFFCAT